MVNELKDALPDLFTSMNSHALERRIIAQMSDSRLLSLARAHEQDSLGVEIMHYVNSCVEACLGTNLQISRINASSLDNVTSQSFFEK